MRTLILLAALLGSPLSAQSTTPMSVEQFERFVTNRIFTYNEPGDPPYGIESYATGRRFVWAFFGGQCEEGTYRDGPNDTLCFDFDTDGRSVCWMFVKDGNGGMNAIGSDGKPYQAQPTTQSMPCIDDFLGA